MLEKKEKQEGSVAGRWRREQQSSDGRSRRTNTDIIRMKTGRGPMLLDGDEEHNRIENNTIEKNITNGEGELLAAFASYI